MSDLVFDLLDELYFVISFQDLQQKLNWSEVALRHELSQLIEVGWVKCFAIQSDNTIETTKEQFEIR